MGITGFEADEILHQKLQVTAELPMEQHLTFIISIGNTESDIDRLVKSFKQIATSPAPPAPPAPVSGLRSPVSGLPLSPRQAYFAEKETIPIEKAIDRISGELVCPYPPGIPVLMPGERITSEAIEYLQKAIESGANITGASDSSLKTLKILR